MTRGGGRASLHMFRRISEGRLPNSSKDCVLFSDARSKFLEVKSVAESRSVGRTNRHLTLFYMYTNLRMIKMGRRTLDVDEAWPWLLSTSYGTSLRPVWP